MSHGRRVIAKAGGHRRRRANRGRHCAGTILAVLSIAAFGVSACSATGPSAASPTSGPGSSRDPLTARTRLPSSAAVVLTSTPPDELAAGVARQLFRSAPVVVVSTEDPAAVTAATGDARRAAAPLLLTAPLSASTPAGPSAGTAARGASASARPPAQQSPAPPPGPATHQPPAPSQRPALPQSPQPSAIPAPSAVPTSAAVLTSADAPAPAGPSGAITGALRAEIRNLHPRDVLVVGLAPDVLAAKLPGINVTGAPSTLPATKAPPPLSHVAVLTAAGDSAVALAMTATAQVAGAAVVPVHGGDPRADPAAIAALAAAKPVRVVAAGAGFGPPSALAYRVAVAATGVQLPGGGQLVFPGHRLVALYGNPESPALGALGQQDLPATIARARQMAAPYRALSSVPVVPAFEIIATVALGSPGPQGTYSAVSSLASLRPWVQQATAAGYYVILDLQPGRANLLDQAKMYEPLLAMPNVGLALDAEWKLQPGQVPLQQIGSVSIGEVNSVVDWLAGLTAELHLPQKVLVLHQFRLSMIQHEQELDTRNDDLAIVVHMDGQGTQGVKQETWNTITAAAPRGVFFGWKNFFVKDHPMLSPQGTMAKVPAPVMISYQ